MRQTGQGQHDGRPATVLTGFEATGEQTQPEHRQRQRDGERELASHGRLHVAAVDGETLVEQEQQAGQREQLGHRVTEAGEATERPATRRQAHDACHGHDLERNAVREHDVEYRDGQRGDDHVEAVHRETVVPVVAPPGELATRQQHVAQERRPHHMGTHIATGGRVIGEDQFGVHHLRGGPCGTHDGEKRHDEAHDPFGGPRGFEPCSRATHRPTGRTLEPRTRGIGLGCGDVGHRLFVEHQVAHRLHPLMTSRLHTVTDARQSTNPPR